MKRLVLITFERVWVHLFYLVPWAHLVAGDEAGCYFCERRVQLLVLHLIQSHYELSGPAFRVSDVAVSSGAVADSFLVYECEI